MNNTTSITHEYKDFNDRLLKIIINDHNIIWFESLYNCCYYWAIVFSYNKSQPRF